MKKFFFLQLLFCSLTAQAQVNFCLENVAEQPIPNLELKYSQSPVGQPPVEIFGQTDGDGCISFAAPADTFGNIFTPNYFWKFGDVGISILDMFCIRQHILGFEALSPFRMVAADFNRSGSVTTNDLVLISQEIIELKMTKPTWRFLRKDAKLPNPVPFSPTPILLAGDLIVGIHPGDVNGDVGRTPTPPADSAELVLPDWQLTAGQVYELPIHLFSSTSLMGLQFDLQFDESKIELLSVVGWSPYFLFRFGNEIRSAQIFLQPVSDVLLGTFTIRAKVDAPLSEVYELNSNILPRAIDSDKNEYGLKVNFKKSLSQSNPAAAAPFSIFPNPTSVEFFIEKLAAADTLAFFEIFDLQGRSVRRGEFAERQSRVELSGLPAGQFLLKILSDGEIFTQILIKN